MKVEWQESLSIGVIEIDIQHKLLFDKFNVFLAACSMDTDPDEINRLFWFLEAYAVTHFKEEERLMQEIAFPDYVKHRERHLAFGSEVKKLKERLRVEGPNPALISSATMFITDWLLEHISTMDRQVGMFMKGIA